MLCDVHDHEAVLDQRPRGVGATCPPLHAFAHSSSALARPYSPSPLPSGSFRLIQALCDDWALLDGGILSRDTFLALVLPVQQLCHASHACVLCLNLRVQAIGDLTMQMWFWYRSLGWGNFNHSPDRRSRLGHSMVELWSAPDATARFTAQSLLNRQRAERWQELWDDVVASVADWMARRALTFTSPPHARRRLLALRPISWGGWLAVDLLHITINGCGDLNRFLAGKRAAQGWWPDLIGRDSDVAASAAFVEGDGGVAPNGENDTFARSATKTPDEDYDVMSLCELPEQMPQRDAAPICVETGDSAGCAVQKPIAVVPIWPITDLEVLENYLAQDNSPTHLVLFEFSGAQRDALRERGILAISADVRDSDSEGPHYRGDIRDIVPLKHWEAVLAVGPPCYQHLRNDRHCLPLKMKDGRAFWAGALVLWCVCINNADMILVEQPDTVANDFFDFSDVPQLEVREFRTSQCGDEESKFVRLTMRNVSLESFDGPVRPRKERTIHFAHDNPDARDRARSTWRLFPHLCAAIARACPACTGGLLPLDYQVMIRRFATAWESGGWPVPLDYDRHDAQPPDAAGRAYNQVRGAGHLRPPELSPPVAPQAEPRSPHELIYIETPSAHSDVALVPITVLVPVLISPSPLVLVIVVHANRILGALAPPACPASNTPSRARGSAVQSVRHVIDALAPAQPIAFLAGQVHGGINVVALPVSQDLGIARKEDAHKGTRVGTSWVAWATLTSLLGLWIHPAAALAIAKCSTFAASSPMNAHHGVMGARSLRAISSSWSSGVAQRTLSVREALLKCELVHQQLRNALDVPSSDPDAAYLHSWIDRVGACDVSELLIDESRGSMSLPEVDFERLKLSPFSADIEPPLTQRGVDVWHQPLHCYEPTFHHPRELYTDQCWSDLQDYLAVLHRDLLHVAWSPDERARPPPFVRGQECFVHEARGCVWDLRRSNDGLIIPLDFAAPLRSQFHRARPGRLSGWEYIKSKRPDWRDQRLLWYLERGIDYELDGELSPHHSFPLQIAIFPHLLTLPKAFPSLQKETKRFQELGWHEIFDSMPYTPCRMISSGGTPRKLEDRMRPTTDFGVPRRPLWDESLVEVPSINERSREAATGPEEKPTPVQLARDLEILRGAASLADLPVLTWTDDVKDFFPHAGLSPRMRWLNTMATLDPHHAVHGGGSMVWVAQYVLGFGHVLSSKIMQRCALLLVDLYEEEVERRSCDDMVFDSSGNIAVWRATRRVKLGARQARLHSSKMYTDDKANAAVGIPALVCQLRAWRHVHDNLDLLMAIPEKRQIGCSIVWLGVAFLAILGLMYIPKDKLVRCLLKLTAAKRAELVHSDFQSLLGLLEHIRGVLRGPRSWMFYLWGSLNRLDPEAQYCPNDPQRRRLAAWSKRLLSTNGASLLLALRDDGAPQWGRHQLVLHLSSDAARSLASDPRKGLGAFCHGVCVSVALSPVVASVVPIGILELLAALLAILTFAPLVLETGAAILDTDSLSVSFQLTDETARTAWGQFLLAELFELRSFQEIRGMLAVRHVWGPTNLFSDILSRGKPTELRRLASQMLIRLSVREPAPEFTAIYDRFIDLALRDAGPQASARLEVHDIQPPRGAGDSMADSAPVIGTSSSSFLPQEIIQYMDAAERALVDKLYEPFRHLTALKHDARSPGLPEWLLAAPVDNRHIPYASFRILECNELVIVTSEQRLNQFVQRSQSRRHGMNRWAKNNIPPELWSFYDQQLDFPPAPAQQTLTAALHASEHHGGALEAPLLDLLRKQHALARVRESTRPTRLAIDAEQQTAIKTRAELQTYKEWVHNMQPICYQLGQLLTHLDLIRTCSFRGDEHVRRQGGMKSAIGIYFLDFVLLTGATEADIMHGALTQVHLRSPEARIVRPVRMPMPSCIRVVEHESDHPMLTQCELPSTEQAMLPFTWFELPLESLEHSGNAASQHNQLHAWLQAGKADATHWLHDVRNAIAQLRAVARAQEDLLYFYVGRYNGQLAAKRRLLAYGSDLSAAQRWELERMRRELLRVAFLMQHLQDWRADRQQAEYMAATLEHVLQALVDSAAETTHPCSAIGPADWLSSFAPFITPPPGPCGVSHLEHMLAAPEAASDTELDDISMAASHLLMPRLGFLTRRREQSGLAVDEVARRWPPSPSNWNAPPPSPSHVPARAAVLPHFVETCDEAGPSVQPRRVKPRLARISPHMLDSHTQTEVAVEHVVDALPTAFPSLVSTVATVVEDLKRLSRLSAANKAIVERALLGLQGVQQSAVDWFSAAPSQASTSRSGLRDAINSVPPPPYALFGDTQRHLEVHDALANPERSPGSPSSQKRLAPIASPSRWWLRCKGCGRDVTGLEAQCTGGEADCGLVEITPLDEGHHAPPDVPSHAPLPPPSLPPSPPSDEHAHGAPPQPPPPSPPPSPTPSQNEAAVSPTLARDVTVCVRIVQELSPSHYASYAQPFDYHHDTLHDVFEFMIERRGIGHRNTHVLALESLWWHDMEQSIESICAAANVGVLLNQEHDFHPFFEVHFELFHHSSAAVRALSRHATSVHLENAADAIAHADFSMAHSQLDAYESDEHAHSAPQPPPPSPPPSPAPPGSSSPPSPPPSPVDNMFADFVQVRVCRELPRHANEVRAFDTVVQSFSYRDATLRDIFSYLVEPMEIGDRISHCLTIGDFAFLDLGHTIAEACTMAEVEHLNWLELDPSSFEVAFDLLDQPDVPADHAHARPVYVVYAHATSNAAVRALSRHSTSVHLADAADSVAQADFSMADVLVGSSSSSHLPQEVIQYMLTTASVTSADRPAGREPSRGSAHIAELSVVTWTSPVDDPPCAALNRGLYEVAPGMWAASVGGLRLLVGTDGPVLPLQLLAFEECYACWIHHKNELEYEWAFASSASEEWDCRVRLASLATGMLERVVPLSPPLHFPDEPPVSISSLPRQACEVLTSIGFYTSVALQRAARGQDRGTFLATLPLLLQASALAPCTQLLVSRAAARVVRAAQAQRLVPNARVRALSHHATSVNLGARADSVAQADYSMADMAAARIDVFDKAVEDLRLANQGDINAHRAARILSELAGDRRVRTAGLRSIQAVVHVWNHPSEHIRHIDLRSTFACSKSNFESWNRRLALLRDAVELERSTLEQALLTLVGDDASETHPPAAADTSESHSPVPGTSSSSPLPQEAIRYMRAAIRASLHLEPEGPSGSSAPLHTDAARSARAPPLRPLPAARGKRAASPARPPLPTDELIQRHKANALAALRNDPSDGALHFSDANAAWFSSAIDDAERAGVNRDTARRDDAWWHRYWLPITSTLSTSAIRDFPAAVSGADMALRRRETTLLVFALIMILTMMQPRRRSSPAPQVSSALHVLLGVRRIHSRMNVDMVPFRLIRDVVKGLTMRFIELHGHEALLPHRKAPLAYDAFQALLGVPPGTHAGIHYVGLLVLSTRAVMCLLWASGFRKAELVNAAYYLRIGSLVWCLLLDDGPLMVILAPSVAQLKAALPGSFVQCTPRQSKCDVTGAVWGDKKTFHSFNAHVGNAFSALRDFAVHLLQRGQYHADVPLFVNDDLSLVSAAQAQRLLNAMLDSAGLAHLIASLSWHSFRISLATRLGRVGCPPDKIQALCRWQNPASLLIYRRLGLEDYQEWIEKAAFSVEFTQGSLPSVCIESTPGLMALTADSTAATEASPSPVSPHPRLSPHPPPPSQPPALTMKNAVGRSVLVPILPGWESYPCNEHGGRGWTARIVATRAHKHVSLRFLHARDAEGRKYPDHSLPLAVLQQLPTD